VIAEPVPHGAADLTYRTAVLQRLARHAQQVLAPTGRVPSLLNPALHSLAVTVLRKSIKYAFRASAHVNRGAGWPRLWAAMASVR
jgi:hypothetical protein